jgi:hypothetical protein
MANEFNVRAGISVRGGNVDYQSRPGAFSDDLVAAKAFGPVPGAFVASTAGTDADLSQIGTPGWVELKNLEPDGGNDVQWGVRRPASNLFLPVGILEPGQSAVFKLSPSFGMEYLPSTGTGTSAEVDKLHFKATGGAVNVFVGAFER